MSFEIPKGKWYDEHQSYTHKKCIVCEWANTALLSDSYAKHADRCPCCKTEGSLRVDPTKEDYHHFQDTDPYPELPWYGKIGLKG